MVLAKLSMQMKLNLRNALCCRYSTTGAVEFGANVVRFFAFSQNFQDQHHTINFVYFIQSSISTIQTSLKVRWWDGTITNTTYKSHSQWKRKLRWKFREWQESNGCIFCERRMFSVLPARRCSRWSRKRPVCHFTASQSIHVVERRMAPRLRNYVAARTTPRGPT